MMKAYIYVVFWIIISCAMILFNKAVLSQVSRNFYVIYVFNAHLTEFDIIVIIVLFGNSFRFPIRCS